MLECLLVGLGGGIGAMGRYMMGKIPFGDIPYPVSTFLVNIIGAFMIGLFYTVAAKNEIDSRLLLLLTTGLCGGLTTMSTFSWETLTMIQNGRVLPALLYVTVTIVVCVLATWAATCIAK